VADRRGQVRRQGRERELTRLWRLALVGLGLTVLAGLWLSPYILSACHLDIGASALDDALLPVYPDRLAPEQVLDWEKLEEATAHLEQVLRWDERNIEAQRLLARVYLSRSETTPALETLQAALAVRPDNPLLWLELGDVYDNLGNVQAAIEACEAGRVGSRVLPLAANYLGMAEAQMEWGSGEAAIVLWRRVLDLDPDNLYALCRLADIHHQMGDAGSAASLEGELERIAPEAVGVPLDFRLVEYQALAMVWLVDEGIWERQTLLDVVSRHVEEADGELQRLMAETELKTILGESPEDEGPAAQAAVLGDAP